LIVKDDDEQNSEDSGAVDEELEDSEESNE